MNRRIQKILAIAALTVSCISANEVQAAAAELQPDTAKEIATDVTLDDVKKIEQDLAKREQELLKEQMAINEKWRKFRQDEAEEAKKAKQAEQHAFKQELDQIKQAQKENWEKLTIKQQLADLIDSFGVNGQGSEIWGSGLEAAPQNITLHIDTAKNVIGVFSDDLDSKGRPVMQWEMDKQSGHITETKRTKDGSEVHVTEKDIDVKTLSQDPIPQLEEQIEKVKETEAKAEETKKVKTFDEEYDLEAQRDLAFKIMYCLIAFIMITFGLLYVFFRMTQIEEEQQVRKGTGKGQNLSQNQDTFLDFLAGRMDYENFVVNPNQAKSVAITTAPSTPIASHQYAKAQRLSNASKAVSSSEHRNNSGFGANNLVHLANEERGRFDDFNLEDNENGKTDFALLANFSMPQNQ